MPTLKLTKKYDRYPKYKDSGVKWVGEIPEGWGLMRVKYLAPIRDEKYVFPNDGTPYVGLEHVESQTGKHIEPDEPVVPESIVNRFEINDVLFGKLRPYLAKVLHASFEGYCTGELLVMVPGKIIPRYLYYKMLDPSFVNNVNVSTYGARMPRASWNFIGNQYFAYPDEQTQKNIAACLDEKTVLIDAIIEKKKKQIELLREKRAAIINRAVTKGLPARRSLGEGGDTNAKLVDSGIEWIGKIPEGWEVKKLKYVAQVEGGYAFSSDSYTSDSVTGVLLVRITEVKEQIAEECRRYVPSDLWDTLKTFRVQQGDILITLTGYVGETSMFPLQEKALLNQRAGKIQSSPNIHPKFLYYCTKPDAFRTFLSLRSKSSAQENVSNSDIGEFVLPFPPKREQQEIAEHIEEQCEKYLRAQDMLERSVALLQEFKSALISHVVTGKVKV